VQVETVELLVTELLVSKELVECQFDFRCQFAWSKRGRRAFPNTITSMSDTHRNTREVASAFRTTPVSRPKRNENFVDWCL